MPTVVVKDFLGHSSVVITEKHYVNTSGTLRAAAEAEGRRVSDLGSPTSNAPEHLSSGFRGMLFRRAIGSAVCTVVCTALGFSGITPDHSRARTPPLGSRVSKCSGVL